MAIDYTWEIGKLDAYPQKAGFTNVVFNIHWNLIATDGEYTTAQNGITTVDLNENSDFVEYADLTKNEIIGWVETALDSQFVNSRHDMQEEITQEYNLSELELLKMDLAVRIRDMKNPPVISLELPW